MMDPNAQAQMAHQYAYYSSGDEGGVVDEFSVGAAAYGHAQMQPQQQQHQFAMQNASIDMNQMRPQMQIQMQHQPYAIQQHPSMQPQVQQVAYNPASNGLYHQSVTSPPPPPSPYDPISPAQSVSDHSASGTESTGAPVPIRAGGGVPIMPAQAQTRMYHHHSHSSASSTSSLHGGEHPYATSVMPYGAPDASLRRHSKARSIDRHSVETTPPPGQFHASEDDDDFGGMNPLDPYVNQISLLNRKESTRRQRIQAEQRRRDELRDGYARLKDVLPISSSKSSKVSLIERARNHIIDIDSQNANLKSEIDELKKEVARLQQISEKMAMSSVIPFGSLPNNLPRAEGTSPTDSGADKDKSAETKPNVSDLGAGTTVVDSGVIGHSGLSPDDTFSFAKMAVESEEEDELMGAEPTREKTPVNGQ